MSDFLVYKDNIAKDIESEIISKNNAIEKKTVDAKKRDSYKKAIKGCQNNIASYADAIIEMLSNGGDCRSIDSNSRLYKAFFNENGGLNEFYKFVIKYNNEVTDIYKKLVLAFRKDEIVIYHNNHVLWELSTSIGKMFKVKFNFNHARYCEDWKKHYDRLCDDESAKLKGQVQYGFKREESSEDCLKAPYDMVILKRGPRPYIDDNSENANVNGGKIGNIIAAKEKFDWDFVEGTFEIFEKLIDSFFQSSEDQFRKLVWEQLSLSSEQKENINELGKNPYIEKRWQQRLFHHFKFTDCGGSDNQVFAYDLEFSQAFPDKKLTTLMGGNEPDILAVRFVDGKAVKLVLIEVKSTYTACDGRSGIVEHVNGMNSYSKMQYFIESRINDACKVLKNYRDSGLYPALNDVDIDSVEMLKPVDIEKVILLTPCQLYENSEGSKNSEDSKNSDGSSNSSDTLSALDYLQVNWDVIDKIGDIDPECKIWYTQSNYFDDDIDIKMNIQDLYDSNKAEAIKQIIADRKTKQSQNGYGSWKTAKNRTAKGEKSTSLRGKIIKHAIFGEGVVIKHDVKHVGDMLTVKFGSEKKEINYQVCIEKNLIEVK